MKTRELVQLAVPVMVAVAATYLIADSRRRADLADASRAHAGEVHRLQQELAAAQAKTSLPQNPAPPPTTQTQNPDAKTIQSFPSTAEFLAMKPCQAKLVSTNPCTGTFQDAQGRKILVGGPFGANALIRFVHVLDAGQTYELPAAFIDFLDHGERGYRERETREKTANEKF